MKKIICMALCAIALMACKDEKPTPPPVVKSNSYIGLLSVTQSDGSVYEQQNLTISVKINDNNTADITMLQVKFAESMPFFLTTMNIPGVATAAVSGGLSLSGDNIVPTATTPMAPGVVAPYPSYTMTGLTGKLTNETLTLSMMCGLDTPLPLTFSGEVAKTM